MHFVIATLKLSSNKNDESTMKLYFSAIKTFGIKNIQHHTNSMQTFDSLMLSGMKHETRHISKLFSSSGLYSRAT
jgi:hypothetical protein